MRHRHRINDNEKGVSMPSCSISRAVVRCAVVDENSVRRRELTDVLAKFGYLTAELDTRDGLVEYMREAVVDLVLVMEPTVDEPIGPWVEQLRNDPIFSGTPLTIVGRESESEMVAALMAGADVYLNWPVSHELIIARLEALLRRVRGFCLGSRKQSHGSGIFFLGSDRVCLGPEPVLLTRMEYRAAHLLFSQYLRVVTFDDLWRVMWEGVSMQEPRPHNVRVHISRLRIKLKLNGENGYRLMSVRGEGYRLVSAGQRKSDRALSRSINY
ncbi:response regulator transcription factor [Burkholderia sola]|uniref:response regulator transcription factor n=1 Tax=Burkholderia sola TaxID=2843302 RepID=UPI0023DD677F|nr:response regulator transcription factor [Burkholderia sola]MDF3084919.1 response regulator transcription factor [Burkholderia sola]